MTDVLEYLKERYNKPFTESENPHGLIEESKFEILFPAYREKYFQQTLPLIVDCFKPFHIEVDLDLIKGKLSINTTRKTFDPCIILKARDMLKLIARSVPFEQAVKILRDEIFCEVVKCDSFCKNKTKFIKRRERLVGPNGYTLKSLEILTKSYILVHGRTVSLIGGWENVMLLKRIVIDCFSNIHPAYHIKDLMVKRELSKDPKLAEVDWDKYLPKLGEKSEAFRQKKKLIKKEQKRRKKNKIEREKEGDYYKGSFMRKEDIQMLEGTYKFEDKKSKDKNQNKESKDKNKDNDFNEKKEKKKGKQRLDSINDSKKIDYSEALKRKRANRDE